LAIGYMLNRISKISFLINGSLGGLVAITACCHCVSVSESVIIGAIAGGVCLMCDEVLLSFGIDDAVSAVPVHLGCGIWGTLAVALFGDPDILGTGLGFYPQLMIQVGGIIAAFVVAFLLPFFIIREINRFSPLRVSAEDENIGLNISEHGARTEAADFLRVMELHEKTGDLSLKVPVDPFTDTGVIAARYNQMMDVLHRIGATFQHLFDGSPQAVVSTDVKGCITRANRGFQSLFGYPATAVVGASNIDLIVPESHCLESVTLRQTILSGKSVEKETHRKHQSGKLIPVSMLGFPLIINNAVEGVFYIYQDITERKTMEDQLYRKAFYDSLTGVPNRVLFMERLKHAFQRKQRKATFNFTVLLIDLDRFKWVNDNLGHQAGDLLLRKVARRFLGCLRSADTLARLGGDEFAVLLEDIAAPKEIVTIAWRLRNEAARPFSIQGTEVFISASIGVILNTSRYTKPDHILRDADIAMYRAKITGKSRFKVFSKKLYQMTHDALQLENDLKKAVERNEFTLFYQPIVCARTEALKGFEALIRWEHPTRGMLPPNKFIPMAEDTGLIVPIGQWVIETACRQLKAWRTRLPAACDLTVSVNISAQQFVHHNLEIIVENSLGAVDLPSGSLMLELTENSVIDKPEAMISHLKKLKEIGVKIAIDDFGTGYFSLAYLKHFPLDCLKIDKSFVDEINTSRENQQIAQAIIMLARNLDLEVVAEGIEDQEQLEIIRSLDCNFIQGYYYSKPLAVKDCEDVIQMAPRHMAPGAVRV
ncbi:MAG TPA: hypothetical protein DHV36_12575, partial [Desulfobacteraceae bacterium]|nr:hypothetical protein [Desulfobacteraceae bacterium]